MTTTTAAPTTVQHWIAGAHHPGHGQRTHVLHDPSTGRESGAVQLADATDVEACVAAAVAAREPWAATSLARRGEVLFGFRELLARHRDELAAMISAEHGKTPGDAAGEVARGLEAVEFACGAPQLLKGELSTDVSTGVDVYSLHQPLGVVVGITPFNFPLMVPLWMFPMAIACGNTFILKPSERDPSVPLRLAELFSEAGLPPGVCNVLQGDREAVDALLTHPEVAAASFVGSTPVAKHVHATATAHGKRVQALGGAKNHMVVLPDADLPAAADAAVSAAYGSSGERCMAVSVVVAVGDVADDLVAQIGDRARLLRAGPPDDAAADLGPLITAEHRDRVAGYVAGAADEGAQVVLDGRDAAPDGSDGYWVGPSLVDHVTADMAVYRDEVFGPVLSVVRVDDLDAALALINANPYGNGTAIFTGDGASARRFQTEVQVGMVGINVPVPVPVSYHPFGGWKQSLFGDTHVNGAESVRFYTRRKAVTARWRQQSGVELAFPSSD